jgi:hypothetical protein
MSGARVIVTGMPIPFGPSAPDDQRNLTAPPTAKARPRLPSLERLRAPLTEPADTILRPRSSGKRAFVTCRKCGGSGKVEITSGPWSEDEERDGFLRTCGYCGGDGRTLERMRPDRDTLLSGLLPASLPIESGRGPVRKRWWQFWRRSS